MLKVNTTTYGELLKRGYEKKSPFMVYGGPGVGKSDIPLQVFKKVAKDMKLEFYKWSYMSKQEKTNAINNPEKYFIFCDQRISQMDSTDLRGIPKMDGEFLETCPLSWIIYFTQPKAHGIIFFDEINLAAPVVASQAYQIINDREISDRKLGDGVYVIGAGNRAEDKAFTFEMPVPLRDRFNEIELYPDVKSWSKWAASSNVNCHLVTFVNWKEMYLYTVDKCKDTADKPTTPRGIKRASDLVGADDIMTNESHMHISCACGEAFATEFQAYIKHYKELDWGNIYKNPKSVSDMTVDVLWAVAGGLVEQFNKSAVKLDTVFNVIMNMKPDFSVVTFRLIRDSGDKFKSELPNSKEFTKFIDKYEKYIL